MYDNELTVTCLFNHIKLVAEMNRELDAIETYKSKCSDYEQRISFLSTKYRREIAQYKKRIMILGGNTKDLPQMTEEELKEN